MMTLGHLLWVTVSGSLRCVRALSDACVLSLYLALAGGPLSALTGTCLLVPLSRLLGRLVHLSLTGLGWFKDLAAGGVLALIS
jgi:hypothetical protein